MRRRTLKRRLFWSLVICAVLLLALAAFVVRAVAAVASTGRRPQARTA
jgi:hypothetical protein